MSSIRTPTERRTSVKMKVGLHLNLSEYKLLERLNLPVFQTTIGGLVRIPTKDLVDLHAQALAPHRSKGRILVVHASVQINPAVEDEGKWKRAVGMLKFMHGSAARVGADYMVLHPGSGSLDNVIRALEVVLSRRERPRILLETDAGSKTGKKVGSVKNIYHILESLSWRVGSCLDTAHSYGRGDTETARDLLGAALLLKPELIHLNDSDPEVSFGSRLDRHSVVIGTGAQKDSIFQFAQFVSGIPMILEQPLIPALHGLKKLRSLFLWKDCPRELIQREKEAHTEALGSLKGRPCVLCGRPANSVHHVIMVRHFGPGGPENGVPVCLGKGCHGHWLLNRVSYLWKELHVLDLKSNFDASLCERAKKEVLMVSRFLWGKYFRNGVYTPEVNVPSSEIVWKLREAVYMFMERGKN